MVEEIFAAFLDGYGLFAIAERLTRNGVPSPSAHDPARKRHRSGVAWSKSAVRAILTNPRYLGHQVWNRQGKHEVLMNVDDVGLGHTTRLRWNAKEDWVWSEKVVHPPIVSKEDFDAVQTTLTGRGNHHTDKTRKPTSKPYQLRGLLYCGICDRKMQGQWVNDAPYYRCRFPEEYALANHLMHSRNVYLREDRVVPRLDRWLGRLFAPHRVDQTLALLVAAQDLVPPEAQALVIASRQIAECDRKLAQHRAALEAGAEPALVAGWIQEELVRKKAAEQRLSSAHVPPQNRLGREEWAEITHRLGDMVRVLSNADPIRKCKIYAKIGLRLTYHLSKQKVLVTSSRDQDPIGDRYVSEGGLELLAPGGPPRSSGYLEMRRELLRSGFRSRARASKNIRIRGWRYHTKYHDKNQHRRLVARA
ncbi:recombinase family protein [Nonomuraea jiangxiensis]|uniref:recombinase family protein n=1 Tax=Nonomuraea jiangxiensis TaxID=633440 RepID=UPI003CCBAC95